MSAVGVDLHRVTGASAEVHRSGGTAWIALTFESDGETIMDVTLFSADPEALLAMLAPHHAELLDALRDCVAELDPFDDRAKRVAERGRDAIARATGAAA